LWPVEVTSAALESMHPPDSRGKWAEASLRISLRCTNNTRLAEMKHGDGAPRLIDRLRFFINGEAPLVYSLYEMIFNNAVAVELRPINKKKTSRRLHNLPSPISLPATVVEAVGFAPDEGLLPYTARSFMGYRLLTEYFAFPEKFLFFDVTELESAARAGFGDEFEIIIRLRDVQPPRAPVEAATFQLGCAPIVNLFHKTAEPIQLTQQQNEYHVMPDVHRQMAMEIYAIESVTTTDPYLERSRPFLPFYSYRHTYEGEPERTFWYATRRPSTRPDDTGTEVYLSLVDMNFNPRVPAVETVTVHATCTNRDLPARLPFGGREGDFEVEGAAPLASVRCLKKPTNTSRPPLGHGAQWRLISHLSLNHLSIVEDGGTPDALREILLLYDFMDSAATRKQIAGINKVTSRRVVRQVGPRIGAGFVRGVETALEFDEEEYVGGGLFLFASVLERFLGLYSSVNSFSQMVASVKQREGLLKRWPPRAGQQIVI
jgi:type VI secretion system protein ImpG